MSRVFLGKIQKFSRLACHSISFMILTCHGLGMGCHNMSRKVKGCHVTSKGMVSVAKSQTQLYLSW
jgi:hypothetical protein